VVIATDPPEVNLGFELYKRGKKRVKAERDIQWPVVIEVPLSVPSGNAYRPGGAYHHWAKYKRLREEWRDWIVFKLGGPKLRRLQKWVEKNRPKMRVQFTCHRKRMIDPSNLHAGLKPMLDCLVMPKRSHPSGLGLIVDDSAEWLVEEPPKQELTEKGMRAYTVISLEPVE